MVLESVVLAQMARCAKGVVKLAVRAVAGPYDSQGDVRQQFYPWGMVSWAEL